MKKEVALTLGVVLVFSVFAASSGVATPDSESQDETVTLTVSVITEAGGEAVKDAQINAKWDGGSVTRRTASNGKAFIDVPEGADVTIDVTHSNYALNFPKKVENAQESEVTIEVGLKGSATIRVTDQNRRVSGVQMAVVEGIKTVASGTTNQNGVFKIDEIEWGNYNVTLYKSGYYEKEVRLKIDGSVEKEVKMETGSVQLTFIVRDNHFDSPKPLKGANVVVGDIGSVKTLDNGEASISVPVNTEFEYQVKKQGYVNRSGRVNVREKAKEKKVAINRVPMITLKSGNKRVVVGEKVRVKVTDEYGEPVKDAEIIIGADDAGVTNSEGVAEITIEEGGNQTLIALKGGLKSNKVVVQGVDVNKKEDKENGSNGGDTAGGTDSAGSDSDGGNGGDSGGSGQKADLPGFTPMIGILAVMGAALIQSMRR